MYQKTSCNSTYQGDPDCRLIPSLVPGLTDVVSVSAGYDHNLRYSLVVQNRRSDPRMGSYTGFSLKE